MTSLLTFVSYPTEKSGKTIHLLKSKSKPIQCGRKRKKIAVLGTIADFKDSKKKPVAEYVAPKLPSGPKQLFGPPKKLFPDDFQKPVDGAGNQKKRDSSMSHK